MIAAWRDYQRTGRRGRPQTYTDAVILCMATLQEVYRHPLRQTAGLPQSVVDLLGLTLPVPDYTTLARRRQTLEVELPRREQEGLWHLVVDSTGIKVSGEVEWKVCQHGYSCRRTVCLRRQELI